MPELSNIQTFIEIQGEDYLPSTKQFKQVLINLDAWDQLTEKAFSNPNWKNDNGYVSSELMNLQPRRTKYSNVRLRPLLRVVTPAIDSSLKSNWISYDLLIETSELMEDYVNGKFQEQTFNLVEQLTLAMASMFGTATYFTNEADDGEPSNGLRTNNPGQLWKFDYALIPPELSNLYITPPKSHLTRSNEQFTECWKAKLWRPNNSSLL